MKRPPPAKVFPLFLKLQDRPCLVVGAGVIAESKIAGLLEADAKVRVVAPRGTAQVAAWAAEGKIDWQRRGFLPDDLAGMFLVVASTSSTALHEAIYADAHHRNILCNVVDVPHLCDFYYPAVVRRGPLQIAISTSGESPALAQRLRKDLEAQFGPEYERWMAELGESRANLAEQKIDPDERKARLHEMASAQSFESFRKTMKLKSTKKTRR
jgi:precorrin-2 dehydrogenase/sirohydrochlorin ferrochelatase